MHMCLPQTIGYMLQCSDPFHNQTKSAFEPNSLVMRVNYLMTQWDRDVACFGFGPLSEICRFPVRATKRPVHTAPAAATKPVVKVNVGV